MISVVIPCYNAADDVGNAIRSVLQQTRDDYIREVIVVNDGSTDRSEGIIRRWERKDKRIQYIYQENSGPSAARNTGIDRSSQEYIAFLDADDCWLERKIEVQVQFLREHSQVGLLYTDAFRQRLDGETRRIHANHLDFQREDNLEQLFAKGGPILTPTVVMKSRCFDKVSGFDSSLPKGQDSDLWLRTAAEYPVHHLPESLVLVKTRRGSVASNAEEKVRYLHQITYKLVQMYPRLKKRKSQRKAHLEYYRGNYLLREGRRHEAMRAFAKSIALDATYWRNYIQMLVACIPVGKRRTQAILRVLRRIGSWSRGALS